MTLKNALIKEKNSEISRTANGMKANATTNSKVLDFFGEVASARGKDVSKKFWASFAENEELTLRVIQWLRDIRGGAGERGQFRTILTDLDKSHPQVARKLIHKIPLLGRWDDVFSFVDPLNRKEALGMLGDAIRNGDALASKWAPREKSAKKRNAIELRKVMNISAKVSRELFGSYH